MKTTKKPIAAFLAIAGSISLTAILLCGIATSAQASGKGNPYGKSREESRHSVKVYFDQTKFPDLPKCAWAKELRVYKGRSCESRWGQVYVILEDGRKITTTYSNIAVEE